MIPGLMTFLLYLTTKTAWYVRQFPYMSTVLSFLAAGMWIAIYVIGFLIV